MGKGKGKRVGPAYDPGEKIMGGFCLSKKRRGGKTTWYSKDQTEGWLRSHPRGRSMQGEGKSKRKGAPFVESRRKRQTVRPSFAGGERGRRGGLLGRELPR